MYRRTQRTLERRTSVGVSEKRGEEGPKIRNTEEDIGKGVITHGNSQRHSWRWKTDREGGLNHLLITSEVPGGI